MWSFIGGMAVGIVVGIFAGYYICILVEAACDPPDYD